MSDNNTEVPNPQQLRSNMDARFNDIMKMPAGPDQEAALKELADSEAQQAAAGNLPPTSSKNSSPLQPEVSTGTSPKKIFRDEQGFLHSTQEAAIDSKATIADTQTGGK